MKHLISIFLMTIFSSFYSKAEINFETSIETHIVNADWIVEGAVKKLKSVEIDGKQVVVCSFTVSDSLLKGDYLIPQEFTFYIDCFYANDLVFEEVENVIGFFEYQNDSIFVQKDAWGDYPLLVDFNLFRDVYLFSARGFLEVKSKERLYSIIDDVNRRTEKFLRRNSLDDVEIVGLEIPFDAEIFGYLYGGSSCYLYTPNFLFPKAKNDF